MEDQKLKKHIKDTFDSEVPDVLSKIKASPDFKVPPKNCGFSLGNLFRRKLVVSFMSVFVLALITIFAINNSMDTVVASTLTIDVNPSIQVELNKNDRVIRVTALNDDGDELLDRKLKYRRMTLDEFLDALMEKLEDRGYIVSTDDENNIVLIEVDSDDDTIRDRVKLQTENKIKDRLGNLNNNGWVLNAKDLELTEQEQEMLRNDPRLERFSRAKLTLVYRIHKLDDSYTLRDLVEMTIRELYDLYIDLEDPEKLPHYDQMPGHRPPPPGGNGGN